MQYEAKILQLRVNDKVEEVKERVCFAFDPSSGRTEVLKMLDAIKDIDPTKPAPLPFGETYNFRRESRQ